MAQNWSSRSMEWDFELALLSIKEGVRKTTMELAQHEARSHVTVAHRLHSKSKA